MMDLCLVQIRQKTREKSFPLLNPFGFLAFVISVDKGFPSDPDTVNWTTT